MFNQLYPTPKTFTVSDSDLTETPPNKAIPFIWFFIKKLALPFSCIFLCLGIGAITTALDPFFFGWIIDCLSQAGKNHIWQDMALVIGIYILVSQILGRTAYQIGHKIETFTQPITAMLIRRHLSAYLHNHSYRFFQDGYSGSLAGKVIEMPQQVVQIIDEMSTPILYTLSLAVVNIIVFSVLDWHFSVCIILFYLITFFLIRCRLQRIYDYSDLAIRKTNQMRGHFIDSISNILIIKLFARQKYEDRFLKGELQRACQSEQLRERQFLYLWRGQHILSGAFMIAITLLSIWGYAQNRITIGEVATVLPASAAIVRDLWSLLNISTYFFSRLAAIQDALSTIIQKHEIKDVPEAKSLRINSPDIRLDHVTFSYENKNVFQNFSLNIPAYQTLGLVGPSGAGKSSLLQILLRLFDIQKGAITIDGQNIATVTQQSLREHISIIPQNADLMHRSIFKNIAYGKPSATLEDVITAAKQAHIHDTIMTLSDSQGNTGYATQVGERGIKLSGGQRQRIAIARAFLKDAPILILDEATSALDSESEKLIQESLINLMKNRTSIVIAHRLSTISHLDRVLVLDQGKIIEDGTHEDLLKQNALYAHLWSLQSQGIFKES